MLGALTWWAKTFLLLCNLPLCWFICGPVPRRSAVVFCTALFVARVVLQMAVFWSRSIPWKEVVFEAGGIIPLSIASLAYGAAQSPHTLGWTGLCGLLVFLWGTWLNLWPEYQRHRWKLDPRNKGKLYKGGLFAVARHINYTGELVSFIGFSGVTGAAWTLWVPLAMGIGLATFSTWEIEFYLAQRYKEDWNDYVKDVPYVMVPGIW